MTILGNHRVSFVYDTEEKEVHKNKEIIRVNRPSTTCIIRKMEGDEVLAKAKVSLHHTDRNNKCVGREFAFRKAVRTIDDKSIRHNLREDFRQIIKTVCCK